MGAFTWVLWNTSPSQISQQSIVRFTLSSWLKRWLRWITHITCSKPSWTPVMRRPTWNHYFFVTRASVKFYMHRNVSTSTMSLISMKYKGCLICVNMNCYNMRNIYLLRYVTYFPQENNLFLLVLCGRYSSKWELMSPESLSQVAGMIAGLLYWASYYTINEVYWISA